MLDAFHNEYGDIPQIGASVDGMIFPDDMRTDGAALVLCRDEDANIRVEGIKEKGATQAAELLASKVKCKNGVIILHFPLVHVPGALKSAEFYARGFYYSNKCKDAKPEKQDEYAENFSEYCNRENIFFPPTLILERFAKHTEGRIPIIGINVMHTQVRFDYPRIFCNFKDINDGIAALIIEKENLNVVYDDIFPERGLSLDETIDIVRKEFTVVKEFKGHSHKNILISLDGRPPVEALKDLISVKNEEKDDLINRMDKGNFQVEMPYMLIFFNKKTNGIFHTGFGAYWPFDLWPFYGDVSDFDERVFLAYEFINGKFDDFISTIKLVRDQEKSKIFSMDVGTVMAFGNKVFTYSDEIKKLAKDNYFGIVSAPPSIYIPKPLQRRQYISESAQNIFFTSAGTNVCLEI